MMSAGILTHFEAEHYVKDLVCIGLRDFGSTKWMRQHERLEKLNIQAHASALSRHDEFVVDLFCSHDKLSVLVQELLVVELWKTQVFPLLHDDLQPSAGLKAYMLLYHEATLCNLLEVLLYHEPIIKAADDETLIELLDYCCRKIALLNSGHFKGTSEATSDSDSDEDAEEKGKEDGKSRALSARVQRELKKDEAEQNLSNQHKTIDFRCATAAVSILRFLSDRIGDVSLSVQKRFLDTHDVIVSLVPLIQSSPWTRTTGRGLQKYVEHQWINISGADRFTVTQTEAQVWIALYNLTMDHSCRKRYHFNSHRKDAIVGLKKYLNDVLVDQLPPLRELKRMVDELGLMDPPEPTESAMVVIEPVIEMRRKLMAGFEDAQAWKLLAAEHLATVFSSDEAQRRRDLAILAAAYNLDNYEDVIAEPVCARPQCGKFAVKRCSRCKTEWYCSRECQVTCWSSHKSVCDLISRDMQRPKGAAVSETSESVQRSPSQGTHKPLIEVVDDGDVETVA